MGGRQVLALEHFITIAANCHEVICGQFVGLGGINGCFTDLNIDSNVLVVLLGNFEGQAGDMREFAGGIRVFGNAVIQGIDDVLTGHFDDGHGIAKRQNVNDIADFDCTAA